uniref:Multiple inositol polyphosphate phosphatase 1 n=1 Tax=Trichogramma kaykai TaxID=54128 RepID=A0ABD2W941_9HYME
MRKFHKLLGFRDTIVKNHERGDGKLCSSDIEKFRLWRLDPGMTEAASDNLVPQGYIELRSIAQRLGHAFPELLHVPHYDEKEFLAHKNCPAWTASTIARKNTECDQFTQGPEMQILFREVSERLGFRINETTLGIDEIKLMYDMCRYESAWYPARESIWCIPFNRTELEILEFRQDLDYYYFAGPGRDLSSKMGCKTLADMFEHFRRLEDKKSSTSQVKGVFYFAHTLTIQHLLSAMGIGVDSPPVTAKDYPSTNRNYRTSLNGPFATNINAVFYRFVAQVNR